MLKLEKAIKRLQETISETEFDEIVIFKDGYIQLRTYTPDPNDKGNVRGFSCLSDKCPLSVAQLLRK